MISIYLDSAASELAIGVEIDGILIDTTIYEAWQRQSELMIPELEKILKRNNINKDMISEVVVGVGPGSYTGVRIALTIAKVMASTLKIPLFMVSSLRIQKYHEEFSICLINARSNRSYIGVYQGSNILLDDCVMTNDAIREYINNHPDYFICGNVEYLGINGVKSNVIKEMASLKPHLQPVINVLGLTPVYLKD